MLHTKVAIMGAGASGLACAIELEKHGVQTTIYEKRRQVGDRFINGEIFLSMFSRPTMDEVRFLTENHGIYIHPVSNITECVIHGSRAHASLVGPVGFITIRGRHKDSLDMQLARQVRSDIVFNSKESYEDLLREYTHVVMATGDIDYLSKLQPFELAATATLRGVTVEGEFSRSKVLCWFDNQLMPGAFGFLIPFSEKEATVVLAYPDDKPRSTVDLIQLWKTYFDRVNNDLQQNLRVIDEFEVNRYMMGMCRYPRIGNTFFTGNCFSALMPLFGFGQFSSILTGIYAAQDICGFGRYEELTAPIRRSFYNSLELRKLLENLSNDQMDMLITRVNGYWGNKILNSRVNVLKWASYAARVLNRFS